MRSKIFTPEGNCQSQVGFTLIEVLVVSAIIGIISSVILFNYGDFNSVTLLRNQAYETALDIRQAQVFSISVRNQGVDEFKQEFGLHFNMDSPTNYIFFRDSDDATLVVYNDGEELETVSLDSRFILKNLCVTDKDGETCELPSLNISFERPHFDATIVAGDHTADPYAYSARIVVANVRDMEATKNIEVGITGLIEVTDADSPGGNGDE